MKLAFLRRLHPKSTQQLRQNISEFNPSPVRRPNQTMLDYAVFCLSTATLVIALTSVSSTNPSVAQLCVVGLDLGYALKLYAA